MMDTLLVKPMTKELLVWRCLHNGPLTAETLEQPPADAPVDWARRRAVNVPLLSRLTDAYGACAMLAWVGDRVVGFLRFYPKEVVERDEAGGLCLQQEPPNGPSESLLAQPLPPMDELDPKTLTVHCMMTGSPQQKENPYQRIGLGTQLAKTLVGWAQERGWERIEAPAYEDLDAIYRVTGQAGRAFWERLGFKAVRIERAGFTGEFLQQVEKQALAQGLDRYSAQNRYLMRRDLV
jgi:hypothetical protein